MRPLIPANVLSSTFEITCDDGRVAAFVVPENLAHSVSLEPGSARSDWVGRLPEIVARLAEHWSLRLDAPYQPGGECAWVAPVRTPAGARLVLKAGWRHDEAASEFDGLRAWDGSGTVLAHDCRVVDDTIALLLERCEPGTPLAATASEREQDVVIAGLLRRLWSVRVPGRGFRSLRVMCDAWAAEFDRRVAGVALPLDPGLVRAGIDLLRALPRSAGQSALLATDLHASNVVAARREPWLVIDPKPYVGDPAYDCTQHMLNCDTRLFTDPAGMARRMADLLDLDAGRVTQWLIVRCVEGSISRPALRPVATALSPG